MAKNKAYTGKYDNEGKDDEDAPEATLAEAPPPGTEPHGVPAGLPPEDYMTEQAKAAAEGPVADATKAEAEEEAEPKAKSKKSKKEEDD